MLRTAIALSFIVISMISTASEAEARGRDHGFHDQVYYRDAGRNPWGNSQWRHENYRRGHGDDWNCPKRGRTVYYEESYIAPPPPPIYVQPPVYYQPAPQIIYPRPVYYPRNNVTLQFGF